MSGTLTILIYPTEKSRANRKLSMVRATIELLKPEPDPNPAFNLDLGAPNPTRYKDSQSGSDRDVGFTRSTANTGSNGPLKQRW